MDAATLDLLRPVLTRSLPACRIRSGFLSYPSPKIQAPAGGVTDSARALTASRYPAITILDETWHLSDFIVSGLTQEEHQGLWDMPEGLGFFQYLSGLEEPFGSPTSTTT